MPGVEPDVADLGNPTHVLAAAVAADDDLVDPGPVQAPAAGRVPARGFLAQLGERSDDGQHARTSRGRTAAASPKKRLREMFQSPMFTSQSSMRLPKWSGTQLDLLVGGAQAWAGSPRP